MADRLDDDCSLIEQVTGARPIDVAVDLGNTAVKLMVSGGTDLPEKSETCISARFPLSQEDWVDQVVTWVQALENAPARWWIASVNRSAWQRLSARLNKVGQTDGGQTNASMHAGQHQPGSSTKQPSDLVPATRLITHQDIPLPVALPEPERVGIDRLLSAYRASQQVFPVVVVDAGSAVTVDWVDEKGCYQGGAILPGLAMQASSLAHGTDLLPQIDWSANTPLESPGQNTVHAIRLGVVTGIAAAIDRLASLYASNQHGPLRVLLTGGDAATIQPHLRTPSTVDANLVCQAILQVASLS